MLPRRRPHSCAANRSFAVSRFLKKVWGILPYFLIPAAGALSPLLVIPVVSKSFGESGWAIMAIGQSIGGAAGVVGELGWGVVGPQQLPLLGQRKRLRLYRMALASRLLSAVPLALIAALLAGLLAPSGRIEAACLAAGTALAALSPTWYFIGINRPLLILGTESLPKILTALVSGVLIYTGGGIIVLGILTICQVALTLFLASRRIEGATWPKLAEFREAPAAMRRQLVISVGRSVSVLYTYLPTSLAAIVAPAAVPAFAAVDRLMRMSLAVLSGIPSRLQSWLGSATREGAGRRRSQTIQLNLVLGVVCGTGFALLASWVADIVFAGEVSVTPELAWAAGALLAIICASRGVGLVLVSAGGANSITTAIIPSAITGVVMLFPLAAGAGAIGVVGAGICAETVGLAVQYVLYRRRLAD
jgi:O-antigen/teichoic acid export membrane protein